MPGRSADDIVGEVDWDEWPDFFEPFGEPESDEPSAPPEAETP